MRIGKGLKCPLIPMKTTPVHQCAASPMLAVAIFTAAILTAFTPGLKARDPEVQIQLFPGKARVNWTLPPADTPHSLSTRHTLLESSTDLKTWLPEGTEITTAPDGPRQTAQDILQPGAQRFFRVRIADTPSFLASGGADVFGYGTAFAERLALNSDITPGNQKKCAEPADVMIKLCEPVDHRGR